MISVADARSAIISSAIPVGTERLDLRAALGRTLREDLIAPRDHPPFRASAMDGYAVRACDTPGVLRVIGEAGAGNALQVALSAGECARIFTGAPLPAGADAVLIQEDARRDGDAIAAPAVRTGRHVREAGVDVRSGERVLASGARLDAVAIALAATLGRAALNVARRPRVAILGGGDELVAPGNTPLPDQIFDSMSFAMAALAEQWGAEAATTAPMKDRAAAVAGAIADTLPSSDLTVVIGGASVGDHDHARPAIRDLGGELVFEKVALRPGKPTWFARIGGTLILGLPGNPASAMVCARLFMRPLLDKLCGRDPEPSTRTVVARTRTPLSANGARETYLRAAIASDERGQVWAHAAARQDSSLISIFAAAPALIVRAQDAPEIAEGALVDVLCP